MEYKYIKLNVENKRVLSVSLSRPEKRNAFNQGLIEELRLLFTSLALEQKDNEKLRLVVLRGEGKAFCGGGDLQWMKDSLCLSEEENFKECQVLTRMFLAIDQCPLPVLGLIHGYAIGGGVGLVSVCDHVIAEEGCVFSLSEVKLGLIPACIAPFVLKKIGSSHCRSLFLSGERFDSKKAQAIGLVHEVAPSGDLESCLQQRVEEMLTGGAHAIRTAKNLIHTLVDTQEVVERDLDFSAKALAQLRTQEEAQEGLKAFLEKRSPGWRE